MPPLSTEERASRLARQQRGRFDLGGVVRRALVPDRPFDVGGFKSIRGLGLAGRLLGLGVGSQWGAAQSLPGPAGAIAGNLGFNVTPGFADWAPKPGKLPEAIQTFRRVRQQGGDLNEAIDAYQDVLDVGWGYWGGAELAGSVLLPGGPAAAGTRLGVAAPRISSAFARFAPRAARPAVQERITSGLLGAGQVMRMPWEAEEAAGRFAIRGLGAVASRVGGPLVSRFRRPGAEVVEEALKEAQPPKQIEEALKEAQPPKQIEEALKEAQPPKQILEADDIIESRPLPAVTSAPDVPIQPRQLEFALDDIVSDAQADDFIKASGPSGGGPLGGDPDVGGLAAVDDIFEAIRRLATPGEPVEETLLRRHEGIMNLAEMEAKAQAKAGEKALHVLGLSVTRNAREVIKESALPEIDALFRALHKEGPVPARLQGIYDNLRALTDWTEKMRLDFDPAMSTVPDYFYRGWQPSEDLAAAFQAQGGMGWPPGFKKPRNNATYSEMRDLGFEPLSWNPFEQWRISQMQTVRHQHQMMLLDWMRQADIARPSGGRPSVGSEVIKGWRVPQVGPAFEGKPLAYINEAGEAVPYTSAAWVVPNDVARRLENLYGKLPSLDTIGVFGREIDLMKVIDFITFVPKRAKLMLSFFQQTDFLTRSLIGTWTQMVDQITAGKPIGAVKALAKWPQSAYNLLRANLSPDYRQLLKQQLTSTEELIPGRPGIHLRGMIEAGLSIRDVSIFPVGMDRLARSVAEDNGLLGVKAVMRLVNQVESATRRGLFEGVYPAAQVADITNNMVHILVRRFPDATDEAINGMVARMVNIKYSTIPASQSMFQNQVVRAFLQRVFFSIGESEGLLRQGVQAVSGPYAGIWRKHWVAAYLALLATANLIHFASTGKALPPDRWTPISKDNWGWLPFGYNRTFAAPTIPIRGRSGTELTLDIVGQMDTVLRLLNPAQFISSRESVPVRAVVNQWKGTDFFGSPIDEVGPGGIASRTAALAIDMFAPIGVGQAGVDIARETIPPVGRFLPPGEETLGIAGQILQVPGLNIRGETTNELMDRIARESGYTVQYGPRAGESVRRWEDLTEEQDRRLAKEHPTLSEELERRIEVRARQGQAYAQARIKKDKADDEFIDTLQKAADTLLSARPESTDFKLSEAESIWRKAQTVHRTKQYGTWDKEKGRSVGGPYEDLYDMDAVREKPSDPESIEYVLWRYHRLIPDATDAEGVINWDDYESLAREFWSKVVQPTQVAEVLASIRLIELAYPKAFQTMANAKRYVSAYRGIIDGKPVSYWDIATLPEVVRSIAIDARAMEEDVTEYIKATSGRRKELKTRTWLEEGLFERIAKSYNEATYRKGAIGVRRLQFIRAAPMEWMLGMHVAGYHFLLKDGTVAELRKRGLWDTIMEQDYEQLYTDTLRNNNLLGM